MSCDSKMASFLVNSMSGLPLSSREASAVDEINVLRMSIVYVVGVIEREREMNSALLSCGKASANQRLSCH